MEKLFMAYHLYYVFLIGCAGVNPATEQVSVGIDGVACVGEVVKPPQGLVAVSDKKLLEKALGASGKGLLCAGKVFEAKQPVTVYRIWNSEKSYTLYGSGWSFSLPKGPKLKYREDNGICPSWSSLDRMSSCTIKTGARIVVGPGQSAKCKQMTYARSAVNQVFILNDSRNNVLFVGNCTTGAAWP